MKHLLCVLAVFVAGAAQAVELKLPANARQMVARDTVQDRFLAPIGPYSNGQLPTRQIDGTIARSSWRIDQVGLTPLQMLAPLRTQLEEAGFRIVLDCAAQNCGGYDFRFAAEVLPAPNMYINIRNFHALTALRNGDAVTLLSSASSGATFIQIIQAGDSPQEGQVEAVVNISQSAAASQGSIVDMLQSNGHVVLGALDFESGTSSLGKGPFLVLGELAKALELRPQMRLALVGHTDNVGSLVENIELSRNRAAAVRNRLIESYGVASDRLTAQGTGYLAPFTTNQTKAGREANRRVEAVVLEN